MKEGIFMTYKERFIEEYNDLNERIQKLQNIIDDYYNGTIDFELSCPIVLLQQQLDIMKDYKTILRERAIYYEDIDIDIDTYTLVKIKKETKIKALYDVKNTIYNEFKDSDVNTKIIISKVATIIQKEIFK